MKAVDDMDGLEPPDDDEPARMAAQVTADDAAAGEEMASAATPMATEPIVPGTIDTLSAVLPRAIERLTGGQIPADSVQIPPVEGDMEKLPPAAAKHLLAVAGMVKAFAQRIPGLEQYAIEPEQELTTNDGIVQAAFKVDKLSKDSKLVKQLAAPSGGGPAKEK